jgi:hypothetical protein
MSYRTVKEGISGILNKLGYTESQEINLEEASSLEYGNTFIIKPESGVMEETISETLNQGFYDIQKWVISIIFAKSSQNDVINRDEMHEDKDTILTELDEPANWISYVRLQKYSTWNVQETKNYFVLAIELKIIDTYTY